MKANVIRTCSVITIASSAWWLIVFIAMHFLEPEFDPIRAPGSAYVLGSHGHWVTTTCFTLAAAFLSVVLGVGLTLPGVRLKWFAMALFTISTAGAIIAGLYPMDYRPPSVTASGKMHDFGGGMVAA